MHCCSNRPATAKCQINAVCTRAAPSVLCVYLSEQCTLTVGGPVLSVVMQPKFVDPSLLTSVKGSYTPDSVSGENCAYECMYTGFRAVVMSPKSCMCLSDVNLPLSDDEAAGISFYDLAKFQPSQEQGDPSGKAVFMCSSYQLEC